MSALTFIEYPEETHYEVSQAIKEIRLEFNDEVEDFLENLKDDALGKSYFLESIGLADYELTDKLNWELRKKCYDIDGSVPGLKVRINYSDMTIDKYKQEASVYKYSQDLEILEDIALKMKTLRKTPATSITLDTEEVKVLNKYIK